MKTIEIISGAQKAQFTTKSVTLDGIEYFYINMSDVRNDKLNRVMKLLTAITLVMGIPTIISGIYGMNVDGRWMPLSETAHGFGIICIGTAVICILVLIIMKKRKLL